jgi:hypothetical protein
MSENAEVAARMQEEFRSKMDEELKALGDAFGANTSRAQSIATAKVLEYMCKTHPETFFEAHQLSMWDVMRWLDKLLWYLMFGMGDEEGRKRTAEKVFVRWVNRGMMPPFWAVPAPKERTLVELRIGLDKKSVNTNRSNLCQE